MSDLYEKDDFITRYLHSISGIESRQERQTDTETH